MRLRADRQALEWVARGIAVASLALLLWRGRLGSERPLADTVPQSQIATTLRQGTMRDVAQRLHFELAELPSPTERDWLRALARSGALITWSGDLQPVAIEVVASAEPHPSFLVRTTRSPGSPTVIADDAREIAELRPGKEAATVRTSAIAGQVSARAGNVTARSSTPAPPRLRRLAVLAPAGWESKFAVAALEESGWDVDAMLSVAPGVAVGRLNIALLDTSRYAAAIVIDDAAAGTVPLLTRFAQSGGGVVISGRAVGQAQFVPLLPARPSSQLASRDTAGVSLASLGGRTLALNGESVPLEQRGGASFVTAARMGLGRVAANGYYATWRWRLQGDEDAVGNHRAWWSALVAAVAQAADTSAALAPESAPVAAFAEAVGAPQPSLPGAARAARVPSEAVLFALAVIALLGEVWSRRTRGMV